MVTMEDEHKFGQVAVESLIDWAVVGMPVTLAETVTAALRGIATLGECRQVHEEFWTCSWVLRPGFVSSAPQC